MRRLFIIAVGFLVISGASTALAQGQAQPRPAPQEAPETEKSRVERLSEGIELPTGPMRVELWAVSERRDYYKLDPPAGGPHFSLMLRTRLTGERLIYLSGCGDLILEKMVDDTGKVLKSIDDYQPDELTKVKSLRSGKTMLRLGFAAQAASVEASSRKASKLDLIKGYVNVVYAEKSEVIMIDNPFQYMGGYIKHPVLEKLGMKIKVIDPEGKYADKRVFAGIALQYEGDTTKHIRKVDFYDSWLKPMYARERSMKTPEGAEYSMFNPVGGKMDCDVQMLLRYYPVIEEERIPFEFTDVQLP